MQSLWRIITYLRSHYTTILWVTNSRRPQTAYMFWLGASLPSAWHKMQYSISDNISNLSELAIYYFQYTNLKEFRLDRQYNVNIFRKFILYVINITNQNAIFRIINSQQLWAETASLCIVCQHWHGCSVLSVSIGMGAVHCLSALAWVQFCFVGFWVN